MNWQPLTTRSIARDVVRSTPGRWKDGGRICGVLGMGLMIAVLVLTPADDVHAQEVCAAGETRVDFSAGQISSYEVPPGVEALRITAAGGKGGGTAGGPGAVLTGTVPVAARNVLRVLVGTQGAPGSDGGGGGGSFVGVVPAGTANENEAFLADHLLVVAGGGGGVGLGNAGGAGGTLAGGNGGSRRGTGGGTGGSADGIGGAAGGTDAGDGGGITINGADGSGFSAVGAGGGGAGGNGGNSVGGDRTASGGKAAVNGGAGGVGGFSDGGFGGGGGAGGGDGGGGGGGYAGGGGGSSNEEGGGGGGSSFFNQALVSNVDMAATNVGDGYVFFCVPAPVLTFDPARLDFGEVAVGTTSDQTATLRNTGDIAATDLSFNLEGADFVVDTSDCGPSLPAGGHCEAAVTFTPSALGSAQATLEVTSAEEATATLALTGSGVTPPTWTISGTITDETEAPLAGVTVRLTGTHTRTTTTGDDGTYTFSELTDGGTYTVSLALDGYAFKFEALAGNETANFMVAAELTISGTVADEDDQPLAGVTVALSGDGQEEVMTEADGAFAFEGLAWGGTYTITPTHPDYDVQPASRRFDPLEDDQEVTFTATRLTAVYTRYFGEGAIGPFFDTTFALFNPGDEDASATLTFAGERGDVVPHPVTIPAGAQVVVNPETLLPTEWVGFATAIEADQTLVASRTMRWDDRHYGRHESAGVATPQTEWWFTEGATGTFQLFYLLYNPHDQAAEVTATYYRGAEQDVATRTYTVGPHTRRTVFVNVAADGQTPDPELGEAEISAHIVSTNGVPIVAERALYLTTNTAQPLTAGTIAAAVTEPAASWHFAEGATAFFDLFLLLANPGTASVDATVRYLLPTGDPLERVYTLEPESRRTIWVDQEDAALAATQVAISVQSDTPILAERAMWWGATGAWDGGHVSTGATRPATRWGLAGVTLAGADDAEAYVLIANPNAAEAAATLTLITPDGARAPVSLSLHAWSRTTLRLRDLFPDVDEEAVAVLVESTADESPVPLVVEGAAYASPGGRALTTGSATPALPLPE